MTEGCRMVYLGGLFADDATDGGTRRGSALEFIDFSLARKWFR